MSVLTRLSARSSVLRSEQGFTLLETIIAMSIMVLAFTAILAVESSSVNSSARGRQMNIVGMLARNRMIQTEFDIEGKTFDEVKKEDTGSFEAPYQDYHWKTTVKEIVFPNLNMTAGGDDKTPASNTENNGGDNSDQLTKLVTQYLSKAAREVTVTVSWTKGKGEQSFSISTYWVDLNHDFQISL